MIEIARNLAMVDKIESIQVELQSKDQSRMNQRYSFHDLYPVINGTRKRYYLEPLLNKKINTRHYKCDEENNHEQTKCLNYFYMSKLNCTFPWLELEISVLESVSFSVSFFIFFQYSIIFNTIQYNSRLNFYSISR